MRTEILPQGVSGESRMPLSEIFGCFQKEEVFIQICNHNYLLADAMHRMNEYRPLLADYRALVVDEAHKLPEAASQMDGRSIGREDVQEISYFLNREHKSSEGKRLQDWFNTLSMEIRKDQAGMGDDIAGKENFYFPAKCRSSLEQVRGISVLCLKDLLEMSLTGSSGGWKRWKSCSAGF